MNAIMEQELQIIRNINLGSALFKFLLALGVAIGHLPYASRHYQIIGVCGLFVGLSIFQYWLAMRLDRLRYRELIVLVLIMGLEALCVFPVMTILHWPGLRRLVIEIQKWARKLG